MFIWSHKSINLSLVHKLKLIERTLNLGFKECHSSCYWGAQKKRVFLLEPWLQQDLSCHVIALQQFSLKIIRGFSHFLSIQTDIWGRQMIKVPLLIMGYYHSTSRRWLVVKIGQECNSSLSLSLTHTHTFSSLYITRYRTTHNVYVCLLNARVSSNLKWGNKGNKSMLTVKNYSFQTKVHGFEPDYKLVSLFRKKMMGQNWKSKIWCHKS